MLWMVYALISAFAAALVTILIKLGIKQIDPALAATARSIVACTFLIATSFFMGKLNKLSLQSLCSRDGVYIALAGIAGALSWIFYMAALKHGLASHVIAIERLSILFVIILSVFILGENLHAGSIIGGLLILIGAYLVATTNGITMK